jgi:hypothetical protein
VDDYHDGKDPQSSDSEEDEPEPPEYRWKGKRVKVWKANYQKWYFGKVVKYIAKYHKMRDAYCIKLNRNSAIWAPRSLLKDCDEESKSITASQVRLL